MALYTPIISADAGNEPSFIPQIIGALKHRHQRQRIATGQAEHSRSKENASGATAGFPEFESCHTSLVDGYVVEGHVPAGALNKLLSQRPDITGTSLPGMPMGSPGMSGKKTGPFEIHQFTAGGKTKAYAVE